MARTVTVLSQHTEAWPRNPTLAEVEEKDPEVKQQSCGYLTSKQLSTVDHLIERHSSWYVPKKSVAWLLRVTVKLRSKVLKCMGLNEGILPENRGMHLDGIPIVVS